MLAIFGEPCFTTQVGQIRTGIGFREALAPDFFGAQDFAKIAILLRLIPKSNEGWAHQAEAQAVGHSRGFGQRHLLPKDDLLHARGPATAIVLAPRNSRPAPFA